MDDTSIELRDNAAVTIIIRPTKDCRIDLKTGNNCRVQSFAIQEHEARIIQSNDIGQDSSSSGFGLWLRTGEYKVTNHLSGKRARADEIHLFVGDKGDELRIDTTLAHEEKSTKGNILVKGIVKDSARASLEGMIRVAQNGAGAESLLSEHVMLLNKGAHATARPQLEIKNNDVSSRHSASVSEIDEEKIFYLSSRGVDRENAKKLIVEGFLSSAVESIKNEKMKQEISKKLLASI